MSEELICPDCGGLIGGEPGSGRQVCRCFEPRRTAVVAAPPLEPPPDPSDASSSGSSVGVSTSDSAPVEKRCRVCGKNLKGHRRLKDSRGYMCVDCAKAEQYNNVDPTLIPCPECGRKLRAEGITTLNGAVMCKRCATEFKELRKYQGPPVALVSHNEYEKQSLQKLLLFAGVLLLIMALAWFGWIGR